MTAFSLLQQMCVYLCMCVRALEMENKNIVYPGYKSCCLAEHLAHAHLKDIFFH